MNPVNLVSYTAGHLVPDERGPAFAPTYDVEDCEPFDALHDAIYDLLHRCLALEPDNCRHLQLLRRDVDGCVIRHTPVSSGELMNALLEKSSLANSVLIFSGSPRPLPPPLNFDL